MSTLHLAKGKKPKPLLAGCTVTIGDVLTIEWALKRFKRLAQRAGRERARWPIPGKDYHETRGQRTRRKHKNAITRANYARARVRRDP